MTVRRQEGRRRLHHGSHRGGQHGRGRRRQWAAAAATAATAATAAAATAATAATAQAAAAPAPAPAAAAAAAPAAVAAAAVAAAGAAAAAAAAVPFAAHGAVDRQRRHPLACAVQLAGSACAAARAYAVPAPRRRSVSRRPGYRDCWRWRLGSAGGAGLPVAAAWTGRPAVGRHSCEGPQDDCACELRKILWLDTLPMDRMDKLASAVIARHKNPAQTIHCDMRC